MDSDTKYIADGQGEGDKENQVRPTRQSRQPKTREAQYKKMFDFMKDHNEGLIAKDAHNLLWENLAAELNDIGPPDHTTAEWKKIWSEHKKKNRFVEFDVGTQEDKKQKRTEEQGKTLDAPTHLDHSFGMKAEEDEIGGSEETSKHLDSQLSEKLSALVEKQSLMVEKQNLMVEKQNLMVEKQNLMIENQNIVIGQTEVLIQKLDISNILLQQIAEKP